jgi:hypothetical protein
MILRFHKDFIQFVSKSFMGSRVRSDNEQKTFTNSQFAVLTDSWKSYEHWCWRAGPITQILHPDPEKVLNSNWPPYPKKQRRSNGMFVTWRQEQADGLLEKFPDSLTFA